MSDVRIKPGDLVTIDSMCLPHLMLYGWSQCSLQEDLRGHLVPVFCDVTSVGLALEVSPKACCVLVLAELGYGWYFVYDLRPIDDDKHG